MTGPAMTAAPPPGSAPPPLGSAPSVASIEEAVAAAAAGLGYLARLNPATVPAAELAGGLRALEALGSAHLAARATLLGGFTAQRGFELDGLGTPGRGCGGRPASPSRPRRGRWAG